MIIGISDKVLMPWLEGKEYMNCANESEAISMCAGYYLATGKTGTAFCSADGFMNMLNFITSWIIPESIPMHIVISIGRTENPHYVATETTKPIIRLLKKYDTARISYELVYKQ